MRVLGFLVVAIFAQSALADDTARSYFDAHHALTDGWGPIDVKFDMGTIRQYQDEPYEEVVSRCRLRSDPSQKRWVFVREDRRDTIAPASKLDRNGPASSYSIRGGVLNGKVLRTFNKELRVETNATLDQFFDEAGVVHPKLLGFRVSCGEMTRREIDLKIAPLLSADNDTSVKPLPNGDLQVRSRSGDDVRYNIVTWTFDAENFFIVASKNVYALSGNPLTYFDQELRWDKHGKHWVPMLLMLEQPYLFHKQGEMRMGKQKTDIQLDWVSVGMPIKEASFDDSIVADVPAMRRFLGIDPK